MTEEGFKRESAEPLLLAPASLKVQICGKTKVYVSIYFTSNDSMATCWRTRACFEGFPGREGVRGYFFIYVCGTFSHICGSQTNLTQGGTISSSYCVIFVSLTVGVEKIICEVCLKVHI